MHHTADSEALMIHTTRRPRLILRTPDPRRAAVQRAVDDLLHGLMVVERAFSADERRRLGQAVLTLRRAALEGRGG